MKSIALDTETNGLDLCHSARPFFFTLCPAVRADPLYWNWSVNPFTRSPNIVPEDLDEIAKELDEADEIVLHNAKYDITALASVGLKWKDEWWERTHDTLYSAHLLSTSSPHNLTDQLLIYLRVNIQPLEDRLVKDCTEARNIAKREYPKWKIATAGDPGLPSLKDGGNKKSEGKDKKAKWDMWLPLHIAKTKKLPKGHSFWTSLIDYSNADSSGALPLWLEHKRLLEKRGLWKVYLERRKLIRVIYEMEKNGVTYSGSRWKERMDDFTEESAKAERVCVALSEGKLEAPIGNGTTKAMRSLLINEWKLPITKRSDKTGEPSLDKTVMEYWENTLATGSKPAAFIRNLAAKRRVDTAISYMESYRRFGIELDKDWYLLHPSLNATGSRTLRMSSSSPNEQNISKQSYANLRYLFGPKPGREWWSLDYVNLELMIPAYKAGEKLMIDLFERPNDPPYFGSVHLLMFDTIHPELYAKYGADVKKIFKDTWYQWTKNGDFAVTYGAMDKGTGDGTADKAYHVPGAQSKIKERFQEIEKLNQKQIAYANRHGYVWTFPDSDIGSYPIECPRMGNGLVLPTTPLNYTVSGTAMWSMCKAMVRTRNFLEQWNQSLLGIEIRSHWNRTVGEAKGAFITMQVHDELVLDFPKREGGGNLPAILEVKRLMELSGRDIGIPLKVDVSYHPRNWAETEEVGDVAA